MVHTVWSIYFICVHLLPLWTKVRGTRDVYSNVTKVVQTYALVGVGNEEHVTYPSIASRCNSQPVGLYL